VVCPDPSMRVRTSLWLPPSRTPQALSSVVAMDPMKPSRIHEMSPVDLEMEISWPPVSEFVLSTALSLTSTSEAAADTALGTPLGSVTERSVGWVDPCDKLMNPLIC
jgi:hypothetical protein